jgi:hypothetical protein
MSPQRFKPYPAYKDSGVEWLGGIPGHWESLALSRVALTRCDGPFGSGLKSEHYSGAGVRVIRLQIAGLGDEGHPVGRACVAPDGIEPAIGSVRSSIACLPIRQAARFHSFMPSRILPGSVGRRS